MISPGSSSKPRLGRAWFFYIFRDFFLLFAMSRTNLVNNFVIVSPSDAEINQRAAILTARKLIHVKFQFLAAGFNKTETLTPTLSELEFDHLTTGMTHF